MFTDEEIKIRYNCLRDACQLVSNPVHAFAATPQNVMALANTFFYWAIGKDAPIDTPVIVPNQGVGGVSTESPAPQTYA